MLVGGVTPVAGGATPVGSLSDATPTPTPSQLTRVMMMMMPEHVVAMRWEKEIDEQYHALTNNKMDTMLPTEGYKILKPPPNYMPTMTPARKMMATPTPLQAPSSYAVPEEERSSQQMIPQTPSNLPESNLFQESPLSRPQKRNSFLRRSKNARLL
jgi:splicing factor 3B subunit 1